MEINLFMIPIIITGNKNVTLNTDKLNITIYI